MFQIITVGMSRCKNQSDGTRGLMDEDVPPILKEEQEDEFYIPTKSLHSEENSPSQVIWSLRSETSYNNIWTLTFHNVISFILLSQ